MSKAARKALNATTYALAAIILATPMIITCVNPAEVQWAITAYVMAAIELVFQAALIYVTGLWKIIHEPIWKNLKAYIIIYECMITALAYMGAVIVYIVD